MVPSNRPDFASSWLLVAVGNYQASPDRRPRGGASPTEQLAGLDVDGHVLMVLVGNTTGRGA